jgi:hypothetical protein
MNDFMDYSSVVYIVLLKKTVVPSPFFIRTSS